MLSLNRRKRIISEDIVSVSSGSTDDIHIIMRNILIKAFKHKTFNVILVHNYLRNKDYSLQEVQEDKENANRISWLLDNFKIKLIDYYIISDREIFGLREK
jgi:DNA repair protein RadC